MEKAGQGDGEAMHLSRRTRRGGLLAAIGAAGVAALVAGWSSGEPALSPAEIVALRFAADAEAAPILLADLARADDPQEEILSGLVFDPSPLARPAAQDRLVSHPIPDEAVAYAPAAVGARSAAAAAEFPEHTASVTPATEKRAAQAPRAKSRITTLFNDSQIASIKDRLRLTRDQERYWPAVESALRYIAWRHARPGTKPAALDPDDVERLKSAAVPLIMNLREDQKQEVRTLAHVMGLEQIAAQL